MTPRLSLILPVYNVAPWLPACLDSLIAMQPAADEIIAVDDGSTDGSAAILADYAERLPQMQVIRQRNAGTAAARNAALAVAGGTHVCFMDPDDFVAPDYYGRLLQLAVEDDLDLAVGNATYHFEGRQADYQVWPADDLPSGVMAGREVLRLRLRRRTLVHLSCLLVYRHAFIARHALRYPDGLAHEDVIWLTRALLLAQRVAWQSAAGYFYRQRVRHFTPGPEQDRRLLHIIDSSVVNARTLADLADAQEASDTELAGLLRWQLVDGGLAIFHKLEKLADTSLRRTRYRQLRQQGVLALLWRNATEVRQRRRLARRYLASLLPA